MQTSQTKSTTLLCLQYHDPECYYAKNGSRSCPVSVSGVESSMDHKYQNDVFVYDTKLDKFGRGTPLAITCL